MPVLPAFLTSTDRWRELSRAIERGIFPSSVAFVLDKDLHMPLLKEVAKLWLCGSGSACGKCPSCLAWSGEGHPDLIVASYEGPPSVEDCRGISADLHLRPVVAPRRVAAVFFADDLNVNASNSLLKLTEEPPESGHVFFFMEKDSLIPTLRSRVWRMCFPSENLYPAIALPDGREGWLNWVSRISVLDRDEIAGDLHGFCRTLTNEGNLETASELSQLIFLANQTYLSSSMIGDMAFLLIEEGYPLESFFDGIW